MTASTVYISSTFEDLKEYRGAVFEALDKAGFDVGRMEGYAASDERPLDVCLNDVESRDIYVGIFAWRYGYVPPKDHGNLAGLSITECEYRQALLKNKPTLCFFHDPKAAAQWPNQLKDEVTGQGDGGALIRALRNEISTEKMADFFRTPWELAAKVLAAIMRRGAVRRPFTVPTLPQGFIPRLEITGNLVTALLADKKVWLAIHGGGGFGKTTLAIELCHEPEVVRAFPDGTVWVTLGEKHYEVERKLAEVYAALTGKTPAATTVAGICAEVRRILSGKRFLIVVDDVWSDAHLEPFGDLCAHRLMYTTRKRELAKEGGIEVREMTTSESMQLLARGMPEATNHRQAVQELATKLGGWALLLELANARLLTEKHRRGSLEAAFEYLGGVYQERGVTGFDRKDTNERNKAVLNCLDVGLEVFEETLPGLKLRAGELGLFPEDSPIPEHVLCDLWGCDKLTLEEDTLRHLDDLSIIRWDRQEGVVRLHDSVRAALANWMPDRKSVHRRLLGAWGNPMRLPYVYAWSWYGWHCLAAGCPGRLRRVLLNPTWLRGKLDNTDTSAVIADCELLTKERGVNTLDAEFRPGRPTSTPDTTIRWLTDGLRKSAYILAQDKSQLLEQLFGRLRPGITPELDELSERIRRDPGRHKLRARFANLEPVGSPLLLTLAGHQADVEGALLIPNGNRALSWSNDRTLRLWDLERGDQVGKTLVGHKEEVLGALLLPSGKQALSWSNDGTLRLWDLERGDQVGKTLVGHKKKVLGALLLSDGRKALSWGEDNTIRLWDLDRTKQVGKALTRRAVEGALVLEDKKRALAWGRQHRSLIVWDMLTGKRVDKPVPDGQGPDGLMRARLLPDGKRALFWTYDGTLRLWDLEKGREVGEPLAGHESLILDALLLPDGKRAVSWSLDRTMRMWDLETSKLVGKLVLDSMGLGPGGVGGLVFPDGKQLLAWSGFEQLHIWDLDTGKELGEPLTCTFGSVKGAVPLSGGKRALSWGDNRLRIWDLDAGWRWGARVRREPQSGTHMLVLPYRNRILSWEWKNAALWLWDVRTGKKVSTLVGHKKNVNGALLLPDGERALSWGEDATLRMWDLKTGRQISKPLIGHNQSVGGAILLQSGRCALSWSNDLTLRLWDLETGKHIGHPLVGHEDHQDDKDISDDINGALALPGGARALSWAEDKTLRVWDLKTCKQIGKTLVGHKSNVKGVLLLPDGERALSWGDDETIRVWDLNRCKQVGKTMVGHEDDINGVLLLPGGEGALSWDDDTIRMWDLKTCKQVSKMLVGHEDDIDDILSGVLLLPGGDRALSWADHTIRVWDLKRCKQIGKGLVGHEGDVGGVLLLPDGERALSWGDDETIRLWHLATSKELDRFYPEVAIATLVDCRADGRFVATGGGHIHFLELVERHKP